MIHCDDLDVDQSDIKVATLKSSCSPQSWVRVDPEPSSGRPQVHLNSLESPWAVITGERTDSTIFSGGKRVRRPSGWVMTSRFTHSFTSTAASICFPDLMLTLRRICSRSDSSSGSVKTDPYRCWGLKKNKTQMSHLVLNLSNTSHKFPFKAVGAPTISTRLP